MITGGAQRVGLAMAKTLQQQGYQVVISYRTERAGVAELTALGVDCVAADFSNPAGVSAFSDYILSRYSQLRGLIHNASEWAPEQPQQIDSTLVPRMMQIHVNTPYQLNLALTPLLRAQPGGADIIHMTDYITQVGSAKHIAYAASKAALANLTLSFAAQLAPHIKVNSIAPALLMFNQGDDEAYKQKTLGKTLMGIEPGPTDVVQAVLYLLNACYVTGSTIAVNGGRHIAR